MGHTGKLTGFTAYFSMIKLNFLSSVGLRAVEAENILLKNVSGRPAHVLGNLLEKLVYHDVIIAVLSPFISVGQRPFMYLFSIPSTGQEQQTSFR
jgi:hypothetical protein